MGYIETLYNNEATDLDHIDYTAVDYVIHAFLSWNAVDDLVEPVGNFDDYRVNKDIVGKVHGDGSKIIMSFGGLNHSNYIEAVAANPSERPVFAAEAANKMVD